MVNVTEPTTAKIDVLSIVLAAFGFGGLVYGLSNLGGVNSFVGTISLAVGIVGLGFFIWRQLSLQKKDAALLDLRTFVHRDFTLAIVAVTVSMVALFGTIILLPIYMQDVLGLEALQTGLVLLPGGLLMGLLAPFVGRIYDKRGPTVLLVPGSIIVSGVFWALTRLTTDTPVGLVLTAHIVLSLGLALLFTPLFTAGLGALKPQLYSHGSAVLGTVQQVAGAAGTALFVSVMAATTLTLATGGASEAEATTGGVTTAFLYGAIISMFAIPVAFFIRKSADAPSELPMGH